MRPEPDEGSSARRMTSTGGTGVRWFPRVQDATARGQG